MHANQTGCAGQKVGHRRFIKMMRLVIRHGQNAEAPFFNQ